MCWPLEQLGLGAQGHLSGGNDGGASSAFSLPHPNLSCQSRGNELATLQSQAPFSNHQVSVSMLHVGDGDILMMLN